jgi:hypothetical protein
MKLQDALAILAVHAGRIHNPPLSIEGDATLRVAHETVKAHAASVMRDRRAKSQRAKPGDAA